MRRGFIDGRQARAALDALSKTLERRVEVFKRTVVERIADGMREMVEAGAPSDSTLPANYPDLEVAMADDADSPTFAVVYVGTPTRAGSFDPATTVMYVKRMRDRDESSVGVALAQLEKYSPYTMDFLPGEIPRDRAFFVFRSVTTDEVLAVGKANAHSQAKVRAIVQGAGMDPDVDKETLAAYSDVAFQVLRKEFGIGTQAQPHWRPAIRAVARGKTLGDILGDRDLARGILDPKFRGWLRIGMEGRKISMSELAEYGRFQELIT